jgi:hypothetical protein
MGELLLRIGRERVGLYWLELALEREPGQQTAHKALAEHFEKKGDRDRAAAHRQRLLRASETRPKADAAPKPETKQQSGSRLPDGRNRDQRSIRDNIYILCAFAACAVGRSRAGGDGG